MSDYYDPALVRRMKRGATGPPLSAVLTDNDEPIDLTGATVRFVAARAGSVIVDQVIGGSADGRVTLAAPLPADLTAVTGPVDVEYEVDWPDAGRQVFPERHYLRVEVYEDLRA